MWTTWLLQWASPLFSLSRMFLSSKPHPLLYVLHDRAIIYVDHLAANSTLFLVIQRNSREKNTTSDIDLLYCTYCTIHHAVYQSTIYHARMKQWTATVRLIIKARSYGVDRHVIFPSIRHQAFCLSTVFYITYLAASIIIIAKALEIRP